jgi:hypothetical protein
LKPHFCSQHSQVAHQHFSLKIPQTLKNITNTKLPKENKQTSNQTKRKQGCSSNNQNIRVQNMGQSSNAHQSSNPLLYKAKIGMRFFLQRRNKAHLSCQSVPCQNKRTSGSLYRVMQNNKTLDAKPTDEKGENL